MKEQRLDLSPKAVFSRLLRWFCFALAALALLIAAFYLVENARGRIAWARYKHQLQAKGEKLEWSDYTRKPVPDDQNFAHTPLLDAALHKDYASTAPWRGFGNLTRNLTIHTGDWTTGKATD